MTLLFSLDDVTATYTPARIRQALRDAGRSDRAAMSTLARRGLDMATAARWRMIATGLALASFVFDGSAVLAVCAVGASAAAIVAVNDAHACARRICMIVRRVDGRGRLP